MSTRDRLIPLASGLAWATLVACLALQGCRVKDPPPITERWSDSFSRDVPGSNYYKTGGNYRITDGALSVKGGYNQPLWLRKKLPRDVEIEVTAWSNSPGGDIKIELFGDGRSFDPDRGGYTSSGYVLIFGGWSNTKSMIAKGDEHGKELRERADTRVTRGQRYKFKIVRRGKTLSWFIDDFDQPFLEYEDARPYEGAGHEYFAFSNWETDVWFDDLTIRPL